MISECFIERMFTDFETIVSIAKEKIRLIFCGFSTVDDQFLLSRRKR